MNGAWKNDKRWLAGDAKPVRLEPISLSRKHPLCQEKAENELGNRGCKSVEKGQYQEKGPRCSWATNQRGSPESPL
jgi:hypothetical protein